MNDTIRNSIKARLASLMKQVTRRLESEAEAKTKGAKFTKQQVAEVFGSLNAAISNHDKTKHFMSAFAVLFEAPELEKDSRPAVEPLCVMVIDKMNSSGVHAYMTETPIMSVSQTWTFLHTDGGVGNWTVPLNDVMRYATDDEIDYLVYDSLNDRQWTSIMTHPSLKEVQQLLFDSKVDDVQPEVKSSNSRLIHSDE